VIVARSPAPGTHLKQLRGLDTSRYVAVDLNSFRFIVKTLGGVVVDVQLPVMDQGYPTDDRRGKLKLYVPPGMIHSRGLDPRSAPESLADPARRPRSALAARSRRLRCARLWDVAHPPSGPIDERPSQELGETGVAVDRTKLRSVFDWFFRDRRTGRILVAHIPNLAILLWMATVLARQLTVEGTTADTLLAWAGSFTLGWWAIDEVVRGVNPWRRFLGLAGCIAVVVGVISRLQP